MIGRIPPLEPTTQDILTITHKIPARLYSVIAIHGPIKGQLQARKKQCVYCFNFEIRVSWSLNLLLVYRVPHRTMPTLLQ